MVPKRMICFLDFFDYTSYEWEDNALIAEDVVMAKGGWKTDLALGRAMEAIIAGILQAAGFKTMPGPNTYAYDLAVGVPDCRCHLLEVKDESAYASSPNLCIEFQSGSDCHPSGIYTTEASLQVHVFGDTCIIFKTQPMRNFLHDKLHDGTYQIKLFRNGDNHVGGILVPKADIEGMPWAEILPLNDLGSSKLWRM